MMIWRQVYLLFYLLLMSGGMSLYSPACQAATDSTALLPPAVNAMTQQLTVSTRKGQSYPANADSRGGKVVPVCPSNTVLIQVTNQAPQLYFGSNAWVDRKDLPPNFLMNQPSLLSTGRCAPVENIWIQKKP